MGDSQILRKWSEACVSRSMVALAPLLPFYEPHIAEEIDRERDEVLRIADQLDQTLRSIINRCASANDPRTIVLEMRRLRVRGFRFSSFLFTSRRLLRVAHRRLKGQARIGGIAGEMRILKIELDMTAIDEALAASDEILGKPQKDSAWREQWKSFFGLILLPIQSKQREIVFGHADRAQADAILGFVSASTRGIYNAQASALATVIWRVIQPAIVPPIAGFLIVYAIHAALELLGVHFLDLKLWVISSIVVGYAFEKALERSFEDWHLKRYGRACAHTALRLFWAEVRARSALLGLMALSNAEPKRPEGDKKTG
jgi:hypothetical protein